MSFSNSVVTLSHTKPQQHVCQSHLAALSCISQSFRRCSSGNQSGTGGCWTLSLRDPRRMSNEILNRELLQTQSRCSNERRRDGGINKSSLMFLFLRNNASLTFGMKTARLCSQTPKCTAHISAVLNIHGLFSAAVFSVRKHLFSAALGSVLRVKPVWICAAG